MDDVVGICSVGAESSADGERMWGCSREVRDCGSVLNYERLGCPVGGGMCREAEVDRLGLKPTENPSKAFQNRAADDSTRESQNDKKTEHRKLVAHTA
jgi:hypothetical protein